MQSKRGIALVALLLVWFCAAGCERSPKGHGVPPDVQAKSALQGVLTEARILGVEHADELKTIADLYAMVEKTGNLVPIRKYGRSNCFFNPDLILWKSARLSNPVDKAQYAIVIRRGVEDYVAITFDWAFSKNSNRPAIWCE